MSCFYSKPFAVNPFTDAYWESELQALGLPQSEFHVEQVRVIWEKARGRLDDYLNVNFRVPTVALPILYINNETWMSLTPMEIQSAALALHRATGQVMTMGLGLGYFSIRAASKPDVNQVTVFESNPTIIAWFLEAYAGRPELAKIKIVTGDARETCRGCSCDFAYADIYQDMLTDTVLNDAELFRKHNSISHYHFWGYERVVLDLLRNKMVRNPSLFLNRDIASYFLFWQETCQLRAHECLYRPFLKKAHRLLTYPL